MLSDSYIWILNVNRIEVQVSDASKVVEDHLSDEVVALALQVLVREEVSGADHEQFP